MRLQDYIEGFQVKLAVKYHCSFLRLVHKSKRRHAFSLWRSKHLPGRSWTLSSEAPMRSLSNVNLKLLGLSSFKIANWPYMSVLEHNQPLFS